MPRQVQACSRPTRLPLQPLARAPGSALCAGSPPTTAAPRRYRHAASRGGTKARASRCASFTASFLRQRGLRRLIRPGGGRRGADALTWHTRLTRHAAGTGGARSRCWLVDSSAGSHTCSAWCKGMRPACVCVNSTTAQSAPGQHAMTGTAAGQQRRQRRPQRRRQRAHRPPWRRLAHGRERARHACTPPALSLQEREARGSAAQRTMRGLP